MKVTQNPRPDKPRQSPRGCNARIKPRPSGRGLLITLCLAASFAPAQNPPPAGGSITVSLADALARARQYGNQIQSANLALLQAKEDSVQARANRLPSVNALNQFIYTEGNGVSPSGVFIANDGVHVYNEQAIAHEEALAYFRRGETNRALAGQAIAEAKIEIAKRGLDATVIQAFFAIIAAQRKLANLQTSVAEAQRFTDITQKQEQGGEVAHADVIIAQIDLRQRQQNLQDAQLAIEKAKIGLGVLIFPNFSSDFTVVDDLNQVALLPPATEAQAQAVSTSPDVRAATAGLQQAGHDITIARYAYLPSLGLDVFYGINSNQFLFRTGDRQNLGYSAQATLNIPVFNWGATKSKIRQAELKRDQAQQDLTLTQRTLQGNLAAAYAEARGAQAQIESLRGLVDLAAESLRLTLLQYQAGEATALQVKDAQNTVTQARNSYDDGMVRYRLALASLQSLMGTL